VRPVCFGSAQPSCVARIAIEPAFLLAAKGGTAAFEPASTQCRDSCFARQHNIGRSQHNPRRFGGAAQKQCQGSNGSTEAAVRNAVDGQLVRFRPGRCRFGPSQKSGNRRRFGLKSLGDVLRKDGRSGDPLA
jgi:hypothetical protein